MFRCNIGYSVFKKKLKRQRGGELDRKREADIDRDRESEKN